MSGWTTSVSTEIGPLRVHVDRAGRLREIGFHGGRGRLQARESAARCDHVTRQLREFFAGERQRFDLELAWRGTEFPALVWGELTRIPCGATISYGELARRVGRPTAARAVGGANRRNPIPIVVPCHRVIGASGQLVGFAGGLTIQRRLLEIERDRPNPGLFGR